MKLSILTIVKDRPDHLAQLIEGLRRSDRMPDELIVVDMASDPPIGIADVPFPAKVLTLQCPGLPLAMARNEAARAACGDLLLFLDVDCIPMRGLAGAIAEELIAADALICGEARYLGPEDARGAWNEEDLASLAWRHTVRTFPVSGVRREDNAGLFWSLVFGMRRRRFFELGGFDEAFTGYGAEDTDFGFRAKAAGVPLLFMGGAGAFHQYHDTFDPPLQHLDDIVRNARIFRDRWHMWPMEGWLTAFEAAGLIRRSDTRIAKLRRPTESEIATARVVPPGR